MSGNGYQTSGGNSYTSADSHSPGKLCRFTYKPATQGKALKSRRRARQTKLNEPLTAIKKHLRFQCTFCVETFKTKYDWQRHEKSLHISLERWLCSPNGPRAVNRENGILSCVFCGEEEPTDEHIHGHNPFCQEQIFTRKDHLMQHLCLVHKSKPVKWATEDWKASAPTIRSRCGFCGLDLESWVDRVEHLADHFKMGKTMAEWVGDWGFEDGIIKKLENSIPPCKTVNSSLFTVLIANVVNTRSDLLPRNQHLKDKWQVSAITV